jgi:endonuclease/exonuclease/phosphatase family metal-dependent hydrolase
MSKMLKSLVTGMGLTYAWDTHHTRQAYTHYTSSRAARIDWIYINKELRSRIQGAALTPTGFTDHLAVTLRISANTIPTTMRRFTWRINITLLDDHSLSKHT